MLTWACPGCPVPNPAIRQHCNCNTQLPQAARHASTHTKASAWSSPRDMNVQAGLYTAHSILSRQPAMSCTTHDPSVLPYRHHLYCHTTAIQPPAANHTKPFGYPRALPSQYHGPCSCDSVEGGTDAVPAESKQGHAPAINQGGCNVRGQQGCWLEPAKTKQCCLHATEDKNWAGMAGKCARNALLQRSNSSSAHKITRTEQQDTSANSFA
jgi:hypothetical protein